ncbi:MAG: hypothetical protein JSV56_11115 [Methanomassiliicoccales archaeon]|nr:MAG: hypothetical protein JSV56_11115 [Methanomassiliicoccales archaeon]
MEDKSKKKAKLSEEQIQDIFGKLMVGEEEKAYELLETELFKDKRFAENFNKIITEKGKEFFDEFNKLNIFERYDYIVSEMYTAKIHRNLFFSIIKALKIDLKVTDDFPDTFYEVIQEDFEKDMDSEISVIKKYILEKEQKKKDSE